jgi:hypothetical protein
MRASTAPVGAAVAMEATSAPTVGAAVATDAAARVAVEASSAVAMEVASAVEAAPTLEPSIAMNAPAVIGVSAIVAAAVVTEVMESAIVEDSPAPPAWAMKPRAGSDEESTGEPLRAIVTIRRARIRVVVIVAVGANRRWTCIHGSGVIAAVHRANSYSDGNLCACQRSGNQANSS